MQSNSFLDTVLIKDRTLILVESALITIVGSLFIALCSQLSILLPISPVPFTGQTLAVLLIASLYGSRNGTLTVCLYLSEGFLGLPFFAGGSFGLTVLTGPTLGYLIGFVFAAYWIGRSSEKGKMRNFKSALPSFLQAYIIIFTFGVLWLSQFVGWKIAVFQGFVVFIPCEFIKLILLSSILPTTWKFFN